MGKTTHSGPINEIGPLCVGIIVWQRNSHQRGASGLGWAIQFLPNDNQCNHTSDFLCKRILHANSLIIYQQFLY